MDSNGPGSGPRNAPSLRGGIVLVSLYTWTCVTLGVAIARFIISRIHKVEFGPDDGMVLGGSIVYLGATISWQFAVDGGLGQHFAEVSAHDAARYFKAAYAAQLLQLVAMAFAKLSSVFLIQRVAPQSRKAKLVLFCMVACWTVYSLFAVALQCDLPDPWEIRPEKCANGGLLVSVISFNMATDLILAGWIFPIVRPLHMDRERRTTVAILFGSRALVPIAAGAQAWAAVKAIQSNNPTWDGFELAILDQVVTSLSLIVASLPRIKRFLSIYGSGILYPRIYETEIALSTRATTERGGSRSGGEPLKLVPSGSTKFTTTVMSGGKKEKPKGQQEWQKFVSMGSKQDEHTSTSSLFDRNEDMHGGVMLHQEVTVRVEDRDHPHSISA